jgi:glycosyltransferase involved in cell wall biosynthesis
VNLERFDGRREGDDGKLLLHDGRAPHKGSKLFPVLERAFAGWRFEPLSCKPDEVPDRMRHARAFLHLSRYEGNSIVCNEAMAMDLPCLFTRVGLMNDGAEQFDVAVIDAADAFGSERKLTQSVAAFVESLERRRYHPRAWVEAHASIAANRDAWSAVLASFARMRWG